MFIISWPVQNLSLVCHRCCHKLFNIFIFSKSIGRISISFSKLKSTLPDDASTQVSAFLAKWFSQNNIIKECSLFIPISKCQTDAGQKFSLGELKTRQPYY